MIDQECPESYVEHSGACYFLGPYSSYEAAKQSCELEEARLADVGPTNNKFIKDRIKFLGSNDHWIGSYVVRGKTVKKKSGRCPILKGQAVRRGDPFSHVSCNSAYPFICQKYGKNKGKISGFPGFNPQLGEFEVPFTKSTTDAATTTAKQEGSNSSLITVLVCIAVLIVFAIFTRCMCNRRAARRQKKKLHKIQMQQEKLNAIGHNNKTTISTNDAYSSRANTLSKHFVLPVVSTEGISRTITRASSFDNDAYQNGPRRKSYQPSMQRHDEGQRSRRSCRGNSHYRYRRSQSGERYVNGYHSSPPPSPTSSHYKDRSFRSERKRRRSMGSMLDADAFGYSGHSRDSSPISSLTDSAISTSTGESFRSRRTRSYRKKSTTSIRRYDDVGSHRSPHRKRRTHRSRTRHGRQSRFEEYAEGRPPSPALDLLSRHVDSQQFHEQQTYLRGRDPFRGDHHTKKDYSRSQNETLKPIYFPQMATTWSADDLKVACEPDVNNLPKQVRPIYPRAYPKGPIRVNRHIHNYKPRASASTTPKSHSDDSEHIYESLDDVRLPNNQSQRAVPLQPTSFLSQSFARSSARSRASMRSRELPAPPMT